MDAAQRIIGKVVDLIINPAILLIFSLGFLVFVWGLVVFLKSLSEGGKADEGKEHMLWGIVGMFIMVSVFGIIALISNTFGLNINQNGVSNIDTSRLNNIVTPSFGQP